MLDQPVTDQTLPTQEEIVRAVQQQNIQQGIALATQRAEGSGNVVDRLILAHLRMESADFASADREFRSALEEGMDDIAILGEVVNRYVQHERVPALLDLLKSVSYQPNSGNNVRMLFLNILLQCGLVNEALQSAVDFVKAHPHDFGAYDQLKQLSTSLVERITPKPRTVGPAIFLALGNTARKFVFSEISRMTGTNNRMMILHSEDTPEGGYVNAQELIWLHDRKDILAICPFPHDYNKMIFRHVKVPKVFMTVRDPRQMIYSECLWMEQLMLDGYELPTKTVRLRFHPNFYEISREERIDALIEQRYPELCGYMGGWYAESIAPDLPYELRIFRHEDMKRDLQGFFDGILNFLGFPLEQRLDIARESKQGEGVKPYGEYNHRLGSSEEWRMFMSPQQKARMAELTPKDLIKNLGWAE